MDSKRQLLKRVVDMDGEKANYDNQRTYEAEAEKGILRQFVNRSAWTDNKDRKQFSISF